MHPIIKKIEHFTDRVIPYVLVLLTIILVIEFFFKHIAEIYHTQIIIADYVVIFFFTLDLIFKYTRVRKLKLFLKKYWLDILAVFPFFLIFRVFEEVLIFFRLPELTETQKFLHIGLETEKLAKEERALRELAELQKETELTRTRLFSRFFRLPRLVKVFPFYEKPIKKELKIIEKDIGIKKKKSSKRKKSKP